MRHTEQACLVCPTPVLHWHCARVAHFAEAHPKLLEQLRNDPYPELTPAPPPLRKLGTLRLPG